NSGPLAPTLQVRESSQELKRHIQLLTTSNRNASSRLKYDQAGTQTQLNVVSSPSPPTSFITNQFTYRCTTTLRNAPIKSTSKRRATRNRSPSPANATARP